MVRRRNRYQVALAQSAEQSERASDRVMASLAVAVGSAVERVSGPGPVTEADREAIMETVDRELNTVYGGRREDADRGQLGAVIVAQAHNARKRVMTGVVRHTILPATRKDPELRERMGIRPDEASR